MVKQFWAPEINRKSGRLKKPVPSGLRRATQLGRDLQDLDDHGDGAPPLRTGCHEIVFGGQFVVRADCRCRPMPKLTILILDDRRERGVNPLPRCKASDLMNRGSYERVSKPRLGCIKLDQL